jgi:uncharacterized protein
MDPAPFASSDRSVHVAIEALDRLLGLSTLWVFGSEAKGTPNAESDLDLAALFDREIPPLELAEVAADLSFSLGRHVDLVDLDRVSPILAHQVLKYGRLLVDRNPSRRHRFFVRHVSVYDDLKILRREAEKALLARVGHA